MTLTELIEACVAAQIKLNWNDGKLDIKAPKGALTPVLIASLKEHKTALKGWFESEFDAFKKSSQEITKAPELAAYPLSSNQQRLWFFEQLEPESNAYNIPSLMRLQGGLQAKFLKQALRETVAKHEILRTIYEVEEAETQQIVLDQFSVPFFEHDISNLQETDQLRTRRLLLSQFFDFKFDLGADICLRAMLLRESGKDFTLAVLVHHIAADAWSVNLITEEILSIYKRLVTGGSNSQCSAYLQYKDYAYWQNEQFGSDRIETALSFWLEYLNGIRGYLPIPTDYPRQSTNEFSAGVIEHTINDALKQKLIEFTIKQGVSQFVVLQAVYSIVLSLYSNESDIAIGFPVLNRESKALERMIGFLSNTLVIRNHIDFNKSFLEIINSARDQFGKILANQHLPFEYLVEQINVERVTGAHPIFQHFFVFQEKVTGLDRLQEGLSVTVETPEVTNAKFDLMLQVGQLDERVTFRWEYNSSLFHNETIAEMHENFEFILEELITNPNTKLNKIEMISPRQRQKKRDFCGSQKNYDRKALVMELVDEWAIKSPLALAIHDPIKKLNYVELTSQTNLLAERLIFEGYSLNDRIGICVDRSCDFIIWILSCLKAGLVYVPIDCTYPLERIKNIAKSAKVKGLIVSENDSRKHSLMNDDENILVSEEWLQSLNEDTKVEPRESISVTRRMARLSEDSTVCLMFTSGTTGQPKGVVISHRALTNFFQNYGDLANICETKKMISITSPSFDISISDWSWALANGASLYLCDEETRSNPKLLSERMEYLKITHLSTTPSILGLLDKNKDYQFKFITIAGESPAPSIIRDWYNKYPIYNFYGPTESTVVLYSKIKDCNYIHTSEPFFNVEIFILNERQQLVPRGCCGEIYIGGDSLSSGYFNNTHDTKRNFLNLPNISRSILYRTGDLAKVDYNNNLKLLGRRDEQIKIRGNRIELSEIEGTLVQLDSVREAAVIKRKAKNGSDILVGFIRPSYAYSTIDSRGISLYLKRNLPGYMVPSNIVVVEDWPVNFNGKVDRNRLESLPMPSSEDNFIAPSCDIERDLTAIWSDLLDIPAAEISALANFYELNGNSMLMMRMLAKLNSVFNLELTLKVIVDTESLRELGSIIRFSKKSRSDLVDRNQDEFKFEGEL